MLPYLNERRPERQSSFTYVHTLYLLPYLYMEHKDPDSVALPVHRAQRPWSCDRGLCSRRSPGIGQEFLRKTENYRASRIPSRKLFTLVPINILPTLPTAASYLRRMPLPTMSPFIIYKYSLFLHISKWLLLLLTSTWLKPPDPILQASSLQFLSLKAHDYRLLPGISDCLSSATLKPQTHADGP